MSERLSKKILEKLVEKTGNTEPSIRVAIAKIRGENPDFTLNAAAKLFADRRGFSVLGKLDKEDRKSLASASRSHQNITVQKIKGRRVRKLRPVIFVEYNSRDKFQKRHIDEINKAYNCGCYTAAFVLCRKVIQNLVIDILLKQFPEKIKKNRELYYNTKQARFHDFSVILDNLYKNRNSFLPSAVEPIKRLHQKAKPFSKDANQKTHSWYHVAGKKELDDIGVQEIIDLVEKVNSINSD